jgi:hypothetical protein
MTQQSMGRIDAQLQEAQFRLQTMVAEDEARIRSMQENREQQDIAGLGAEMAYGRSLRDAATSRIVSTGASLAELSADTAWGDKKLWGGTPRDGGATQSAAPNASTNLGELQNKYNPNNGSNKGV